MVVFRKGKERKSIYIALFWPRWYIQGAQAWITQFYLQITPCLPFLRERSPDVTTTATEACVHGWFFSSTVVTVESAILICSRTKLVIKVYEHLTEKYNCNDVQLTK